MKYYRNLYLAAACLFLWQLGGSAVFAQYKDFKISIKGDTINATDLHNLKQGKWVESMPELRGEQGYEDEGIYLNGKKEGIWRRYTLNSDLIAMENYHFGGKDGQQQYFTNLGNPVRIENWRAYNPDAPFDTIPIYGTGSNEIISFKVVKAEQYSVKDGTWKFFDPATGNVIKTEEYDRGHPHVIADTTAAVDEKPKPKVKPQEVLDYEKKNSGRKKVKTREGQTGL